MPPDPGSHQAIDVLCARCGGYGVTLHPSLKTKAACGDCGGEGHQMREPWDGWEADPVVLRLIEDYAETPWR